jgi:hypothetical protein
MATDQLVQVRTFERQLSFQEKLYLLNDLTMEVIQQSAAVTPTPKERPLPIIHLDMWPNNLPLRRQELYDDRGR